MSNYSDFENKLLSMFNNAAISNDEICMVGETFLSPCYVYEIYNIKADLFGQGIEKTSKCSVQVDAYAVTKEEVISMCDKLHTACEETSKGFVINYLNWDSQSQNYRATIKFNITL